MPDHENWTNNFTLFDGITAEVLDFFNTNAEAKSFTAGESIFNEGELDNDLFLLSSGEVEIIRGLDEPNERKLATLTAPTFFGAMSIIECQPRSATVRAESDCKLHVLLGSDLYEVFTKWPDQYAIILHRIARQMARRLRNENQDFNTAESA